MLQFSVACRRTATPSISTPSQSTTSASCGPVYSRSGEHGNAIVRPGSLKARQRQSALCRRKLQVFAGQGIVTGSDAGFKGRKVPLNKDQAEDPSGDSAAPEFAVDVLDKVIKIFEESEPANWKKLMMFSKQWDAMSTGIFKRLEGMADEMYDLDKEQRTRDIVKLMRKTHEEVKKHSKLFDEFMAAEELDLEGLVTARRTSIGTDFMEHAKIRIDTYADDIDKHANAIKIMNRVVAILQVLDKAVEDEREAMQAQANFQEIIGKDSVAQMNAEIDKLAAEGKISPALMLTAAKAYNSVKESPYTKEETKDVMMHLYMRMKNYQALQQPPVIRILKYLLSIDDPDHRNNEMDAAFVPGPEIMDNPDTDSLYTTPEELSQAIKMILDTYYNNIQATKLVADVTQMMNPEVIERMQEIDLEIDKKYF